MTVSTNSRYFYGNGRPIGPKPGIVGNAEDVNSGSTKSVGGRGHATAKPLCTESHCPLSSSGAHHYMIAGQDGPTSVGECRYCGYQRDFINYWVTDEGDNRGVNR